MSRRAAREAALQILFQIELSKTDESNAYDYVFSEFAIPKSARGFCRELVQGTRQNLERIDKIIKEVSKEWDIARMAAVDRNIIRLGLFEILYRQDIPNNVTINEAIELGKVYSSQESGKFINGILGYVTENIEKFAGAKPGV